MYTLFHPDVCGYDCVYFVSHC